MAQEPLPGTVAPLSKTESAEVLRLPEVIALGVNPSESLTLAMAEHLALENHPGISRAAAQVHAAQCNRLQVGLPPNPTVGYAGSEIGDDGTAGQQGVLLGQQFIRGGKLALNRSVAGWDVVRLEQQLEVQRQRVLTDVRAAFFAVYIAERRTQLSEQLQAIGSQAYQTAEALLEAQEGAKTAVLQAEIERERAEVDLEQSRAQLDAAWRRLRTVMGMPELAVGKLEASEDDLRRLYEWDAALDRLLGTSPELAAANAQIERARFALRRAQVEPIPDVNTQVTVQHDDGTDDTITSVQVSWSLPIRNRNQGGIGQARYELLVAQRQAEVVRLRLERRLAEVFQEYQASRLRVEKFENSIVPRADEVFGLVREAYAAGEASYLDLLTAQRTYFQASLEYLDALGRLNQSLQLLDGLLLDDSLAGGG